MQIQENITIQQCRRLTKNANSPILIEVPEHNERIMLFKNMFRLKNTRIYLNKDYSVKIREQRKLLITKRKELMGNGIATKLRDNRLIVGGIDYYVTNDDTQVLCWNVNGLERMLLQFDLFTHIEKCSIFALTETWKDQQLKNKPTGFHLYESLAQRDHKKGRSSGGIIVGIREAIKDKIERTDIEKQWIMICLSLDGEMRVCMIFAYLPPNEHYLTNCKNLLNQIEGKIVEGYPLENNGFAECHGLLGGRKRRLNAADSTLALSMISDHATFAPHHASPTRSFIFVTIGLEQILLKEQTDGQTYQQQLSEAATMDVFKLVEKDEVKLDGGYDIVQLMGNLSFSSGKDSSGKRQNPIR
ncbi:hypothetical protein LAZ67_4001749 [Cordylochernes scorpioides]|uniref:Uncharacterized protein n=1 Tax=Cordylochernes scorpioides TaxID=51811 RepID=A0ABY6KC83_9ARAC|nr:hypothetical protein LAZ67_4001749 [Cordylochernes scorpioides]